MKGKKLTHIESFVQLSELRNRFRFNKVVLSNLNLNILSILLFIYTMEACLVRFPKFSIYAIVFGIFSMILAGILTLRVKTKKQINIHEA